MKRISVTVLAALLVSCAHPYDQVDQASSRGDRLPAGRSEQPVAGARSAAAASGWKYRGPRHAGRASFRLVVNAAPAQQVFMSIVSGTRYSMVVNPEVGGSCSESEGRHCHEALEAIREVYGYEFRVDGTRI